MPIELLPVAVFYAGAVLAAGAGGRLAPLIALIVPVVSALTAFALLAPGTGNTWEIMDFTLVPVRVDAMALVFVGLFHVAAFLAALYALKVDDRLQSSLLLAYVGSGIGAVLAGDLITLWIYWELLALTSVMLVWAGRTPESTAAGIRYLVFNVTSGVTLLAGIAWFGTVTGSFLFETIGTGAPGGWLILFAFGIKAGFPLLHNWIPDAYPRASLTGTVILVAVTTKVGIYALARGFAGDGILMAIGTVMALWPLLFALLEDDLRRVLAYSLMVQLGLMVVAVGVGSHLALDGISVHVVMDVLFKMLLFMALGAVWLRTGTTRASQLGGLAWQMPWTTGFVAVGVAANAAVPFTGGFVSKKLLLGSVEFAGVDPLFFALLAALSGLGMLYLGVRILYEGFVKPAADPHRVNEAPWQMLAAMGVIAIVLLAAGIFPALTDGLRPYASEYDPVSGAKIIGQFQLLTFTILTYVFLARRGLGLPPSRPATLLDAEWFYRRPVPQIARGIVAGLRSLRVRVQAVIRAAERRPGDGRLSTTLAKSWPTGSMAFWTAVLLAALLFIGIWQSG